MQWACFKFHEKKRDAHRKHGVCVAYSIDVQDRGLFCLHLDCFVYYLL